MTAYSIVEAKAHHCGQMIHRMRTEHRQALSKIGANAHAELRAVFDASAYRKSCLLGGKIAAMWGVSGTMASSMGYVWLVLSEEACNLPKSIIRETRRELRLMMQTHSELATTILDGDEAAMRFAVFFGFHSDHDRHNSALTRREMVKKLQTTESLRIPVGKGYAVALGYHNGTGA